MTICAAPITRMASVSTRSEGGSVTKKASTWVPTAKSWAPSGRMIARQPYTSDGGRVAAFGNHAAQAIATEPALHRKSTGPLWYASSNAAPA
jgi:hypothetical protein